jgi:hypothetical protein
MSDSTPETISNNVSNQNYNPDEKAVYEPILLSLPGVKAGKAFGHPAYKVNGKVFAFAVLRGLTIKLPEDRVNELMADHPDFRYFSPDGNLTWKSWLLIQVSSPDEFADYEPLYMESVQFVAEGN